jgi:hypothetical protein
MNNTRGGQNYMWTNASDNIYFAKRGNLLSILRILFSSKPAPARLTSPSLSITSGHAKSRAEDIPAGSGFVGKPYRLKILRPVCK